MVRKWKYITKQTVEHGSKTIKVGFRRDILKVIESLRIHTSDTVVLENVPSIPRLSTLSLSGKTPCNSQCWIITTWFHLWNG